MEHAIRRIVLALGTLVAISAFVFVLTNVAVDPAMVLAGEGATHEDVEAARAAYGLDRPIAVRYFEWLAAAAHGDFGDSFRQRRPVIDIVLERLPVTIILGLAGILVALAIALPLAVLAALKPAGVMGRVALGAALVGQAMPTFWLALLGILVFAVTLRWLPASGSASFAHFILPAATLGIVSMPTILRLTRSGLLDILSADYIRTARAKGLTRGQAVVRHALVNALIPVVAIVSVQLGHLLGGSVIVETIFAINGIGYLAWEAISKGDLPVIQAVVLVTAVLYLFLTFAGDLLNSWLDPRIKLAGRREP
jgi:peptide/nickel transport system permease protein